MARSYVPGTRLCLSSVVDVQFINDGHVRYHKYIGGSMYICLPLQIGIEAESPESRLKEQPVDAR